MSDPRISRHDQRRNEDPETIGGVVGGAAGVGAAAGLGLAALGPLGGVLAILAGAVGGWWAGRELITALEDMDRSDHRLRRAHEHAGATRPYEEVRHGYQLGYLAGRNPGAEGRSFADVEEDLRAAWVQAHLHDRKPVPWEDVRLDARRGYDLARQND